jgi:hypothetical protein
VKLIAGAIAGGAVLAGIAVNYPEIQRYLRVKKM